MTTTVPRPPGPATRQRINRQIGVTGEAAADLALAELERLEDLGDAATLQLLGAAYTAMAAERQQAAAVIEHGARLFEARKHYAALSTAARQAAQELKRRGVRTWPGTVTSQPSADALRRDGSGYLKLARACREAAAGVQS